MLFLKSWICAFAVCKHWLSDDHSGYFYRAFSSPLLLTRAPDRARILCRSFSPKCHRQLRVKDLPKVPMRRLEWDSNLRPFGGKAPNLPMSHITSPMSHLTSPSAVVCSVVYQTRNPTNATLILLSGVCIATWTLYQPVVHLWFQYNDICEKGLSMNDITLFCYKIDPIPSSPFKHWAVHCCICNYA